jgi:stage V sporulation protein AE
MIEKYLLVFLIGGIICLIGQIIIVRTKFTPTRILIVFLISGAILEFIGVHEYIVDIGKAGAKLPISNFGATVTRAVIEEIDKVGLLGIFTGGLKAISGGVSATIFFSFVIALIFNSKTKES